MPYLLSALQHVLTFAAGFLLGYGVIGDSQAAVVGAMIAGLAAFAVNKVREEGATIAVWILIALVFAAGMLAGYGAFEDNRAAVVVGALLALVAVAYGSLTERRRQSV